MTQQHTPGPWKINEVDPTFVCTAEGLGIADTAYSDDNDAEDIANARLIAAAPDLLAACEVCEGFDALIAAEVAAGRTFASGELEERYAQSLAQLRTAIAKARGQS